MCFFRCLAIYQGASANALESKTKELFNFYLSGMTILVSDFSGISLNELQDASQIFDVGIYVFTQSESGITESLYRTLKNDDVMYQAVWPGDGQSVKFWARSKLPNSRYPCKHRKGAFLGVTKAHISRLKLPTFFKLFTQLYGQETDNR